MSSPPSPARNAPRKSRPTSKGAPLAERSQSQTNRPSLRLLQDNSDEEAAAVFSSTPFPTKPAHVLRPSTIRERRLASNDENDVPGVGLASRFATANIKSQRLGSDITPEGRATTPAPTLTLKRSVKALRDLYEAQAERSRPSTASTPLTSPILRPSTAGSGLRSSGSREGLRGPQAWDVFHKSYSDEVGTLPSLDEVTSTLRQIESETSLTAPEASGSDPYFLNNESLSGPPTRLIQDFPSPTYEAVEEPSSSDPTAVDSSSPNVVRLGESSSPTATSAEPSSPNVLKLGSSSPSYRTPKADEDPRQLEESPATVRRQRMLARGARTPDDRSFAARMEQESEDLASSPTNPLRSTPIASSVVGSSSVNAPFPASSPPVGSVADASEMSNESGKMSQDENASRSDLRLESHSYLQTAIESSPAPSIQYPTVRAPRLSERMTLNVAKRLGRSSADKYNERWDPRLSTVPSEWSREKEVIRGPPSVEDDISTDTDTSDDDSFLQPPARAYLASSREVSGMTIRMVTEADRREATDIIADLPPSEYRPQLQARPSGFLSMLSSPASRSNSMRTSPDTRLNSMRSFTSSCRNSVSRSVKRPASSSSLVSNLPIPAWARRYYSGGVPKDYFYSASQVSSTTNLTPRPSTSAPRTPVEHVANIFRPRTRPRLPTAQQSHLEPGVGPLVSNPVNSNQRPVSIALNPADPRAHWAGIEGAAIAPVPADPDPHLPHSPCRLFSSRREWSPHLHPTSRARGRPRRYLWRAPSVDENRETLFNWRNAQVLGFILGFVFPLSWFVAAFLPLPPKPTLDMEQVSRIPTPNIEARLQQQLDIEEDIRYENARWWRALNRLMCAVGVVVIVLVVTLAAVYH